MKIEAQQRLRASVEAATVQDAAAALKTVFSKYEHLKALKIKPVKLDKGIEVIQCSQKTPMGEVEFSVNLDTDSKKPIVYVAFFDDRGLYPDMGGFEEIRTPDGLGKRDANQVLKFATSLQKEASRITSETAFAVAWLSDFSKAMKDIQTMIAKHGGKT